MVIHLITRLPMGGATQLVFDISKRMRNSGEDVLILTGVVVLRLGEAWGVLAAA